MVKVRIDRRIRRLVHLVETTAWKVQELQEALGRIESRQLQDAGSDILQENEFRVYSQWGEDGIIQFLIRNVEITVKVFVEFGVEDYAEANTRFLLVNDSWSGVILDGSARNIQRIREDRLYWGYDLKAECAFITRENINDILLKNGVSGDIGLLSIDIDGNDYWVWQAITCISPRIVVCEYNSFFGPTRRVTIPYRADFNQRTAHFSSAYWGASAAALTHLASTKGYALVGSNSAGNNLFFVRNDVIKNLRVYTAQEAYTRAGFRNTRDQQGRLDFLPFDQYLDPVAGMPLYDIDTGTTIPVQDLRRSEEVDRQDAS
jgi:hypothetical protein